MPAPGLIARLDELGSRDLSGTYFRHVSVGIDPLSGVGALIHGGRWNPAGTLATVYLGSDEETVIEEFHRLAAKQSLDVADFLPRGLHRIEVHLASVVDLSTTPERAAPGLSDEDLRRDDPWACRAVGEAAHQLDREAILAPSAAGPGQVLAVFPDRLGPDSSLRPAGSTRWLDPPPLPSR